MTEILSPDCPVCGHPPRMVFNPEQAVCGNDDCRTLMWNQTRTVAENLTNEHQVNLSGFDLPPTDEHTQED